MCGIVGYIGQRKAYPILIKGLKRLEYRGYDSAGVALISDNRQLNVYKAKGKVSELETFVAQKDISGSIGIAHTRGPLMENLVPSMPIPIIPLPNASPSSITALLKTTPSLKKNFKPKVMYLKAALIPRCWYSSLNTFR